MKEFFIQHAEKLVLGLCLALSAWFLYSSVTVAPYDKKAEDFQRATSRANQNVMRSKPSVDDVKPTDFEKEVARLGEKLDPAKYRLVNDFIRRVELGYKFRDQPQILRPNNIQVQSNSGLIPLLVRSAKNRGDGKVFASLLAQPFPAEIIWYAGNEDLRETLGIDPKTKVDTDVVDPRKRRQDPVARVNRGRDDDRDRDAPKEVKAVRWVEIVAEFPHVEQIREYIRAVKEPVSEVGLRYALAEIQRCELGESLEWSEWKTIAWGKQFDLYEDAAKLDDPLKSQSVETENPAIVRGLVMKVPIRASASDKDRADEPSDEDALQMSTSLDPEELKKQPVYDGWKPEELDLTKDKRSPPPPSSGRNLPPGLSRPAGVAASAGQGTFDNSNDVEIALMRVWDFTVQPGRRYQYRIRAVVFNPNYMRPDVVDPEFSAAQLLDGPWSEPSEELYIEPDTSWFIAEKQSIRNHQLNVTVHSWSASMGNYAPVEMQQQTGQVIGRVTPRTEKTWVFDPDEGRLVVKEEPVEADALNTREILLEVSPGDVRDSDVAGVGNVTIRPPRDAVVMNEQGDLVRRSEFDDANNALRQERERDYKEKLELAAKGGTTKRVDPVGDNSKPEGGLLDPLDKDNPR